MPTQKMEIIGGINESGAICSAYGKVTDIFNLSRAFTQKAKIETPIEPNKIAVKIPVVENCEMSKVCLTEIVRPFTRILVKLAMLIAKEDRETIAPAIGSTSILLAK